MTPVLRVKLGLLAIGSLLAAAFAWSAAQGQYRPPMRPPVVRPVQPPIVRPVQPPIVRPIQPPIVRPMTTTTVWKCPICGYQYQGTIPPDTCPGCKTRMNNGVGQGSGPAGSNPAPPINPPGMNPPIVNPNPPAPPPEMNPPVVNPNPPDVNANPPANVPVADNAGPANPSTSDSSSSGSPSDDSGKGRRIIVIAVGIGILVVGGSALLGGAWLVLHGMKNSAPEPRRRRRRREDDYDD